MQVIGAGRIDGDAVGRVGSNDRRIVAQESEREAIEFLAILLGRSSSMISSATNAWALLAGMPMRSPAAIAATLAAATADGDRLARSAGRAR